MRPSSSPVRCIWWERPVRYSKNEVSMSLSSVRGALITDPLIVLATIVFGSINLVVSLFDDTGRKQIALARAWARVLLGVSGVRVTVEGLEKIDSGGSYVIASNHLSYMDTPVILAHIPV